MSVKKKFTVNMIQAEKISLPKWSQIFKFLSGLNPEYDPIRDKFLGGKYFLLFLKSSSLSKVRRFVEWSWWMSPPLSIKGVAMFSWKTSKLGISNLANIKLSFKGKEEHWCSHYKKFGHTKDTCFKLHGKK